MAELYNFDASTPTAANQQPMLIVEVPVPKPSEILADNFIKVKQEFIIELKKDKNSSSTKKEQRNCKILKFLPGWTFDDVVKEISELNLRNYQNLFIIVVNVKAESTEKSEKKPKIDVKNELEKTFSRFLETRQIIIQLTSETEKKARIFYNKEKFMGILHEIDSDAVEDFPSFLRTFLRWELQSATAFDEAVFDQLQNPDVLTLRFLTIFDFSPKLSFRIVSHCAANFSKAHFLAALGVPFKDDEGSLNKVQSKMISSVFEDQKYRSVLEAALDNENSEVFKYLNRECWFLIQRLPAKHQIEIANKLVRENKLDKLCDLLEISEFLFPFGTDMNTIQHKRFEKIVSERKNLHVAISNENIEEINKFIKCNSNLKIAYSTDNKSAMFKAIKTGKVDVFSYLRDEGFIGKDFPDLQQSLRLQNIQNSLTDSKKSAQILAARSKIHHREDLKNDECEQREKIKTLFLAIHKTELGDPLINAAAQCADLQIIFDFARTDVAGVDLDSTDADGITYPESKVIIIGAKYSTDEQEQEIKGTLAHELAHYVIGLVFGNEEQPYFNQSDARYLKYKEIVDKYKYLIDENVDDECEEIISKVYRCYNESDFDAELIVRIFHIQARYDHDQVKVKQLMKKYSDLFAFGLEDVLPEMKKLNLSQFELVKIFNDFSGLFSNISKKNLKLPASEQVRSLFKNNLTVVTSNVPKLFFVEALNHSFELFGNLAKTKNLFMSQECLEKKEIRKYLQAMLEKNKELNVFIDFSSGNFDVLKYFDIPSDRCFVIVVSNETQSNKVVQILRNEGLKPEGLKIDYKWKNLNCDAQTELLQHKVNFQKNPNLTLSDLFGKNLSIDSTTLNMILNDPFISVNLDIGLETNKIFELLYIERELVKCEKEDKIDTDIEELMHDEITDEEGTESMDDIIEKCIKYFRKRERCEYEKKTGNKTSVQLNELFDAKIVLISDLAGSGKSWTMRNLAIKLARSKPTRWVTFVDLKQFIPHFKKCIDSQKFPNFHSFIVEEVLDKKTKFELEIFNLKYEKGESAIFLDGFDEIAPNCSEYVRELIKTFDFSNQIVISTRDYFEVDLQNVLKMNFAFKMDEFLRTDGENLIARIWRLNDLKDLEDVELERDIINSMEFQNYIETARKIIEKTEKMDFWHRRGIGMPQIYSMIATITKENKSLDGNLSTYQLYLKMYEMTYAEWSTKNDLRKEVNIKKQVSKVNFPKLHELKAMQRFKSGKKKYCDINPQYEWEEVLVNGCGILAKRGEEFVFIHETFYEFFVAEFILRNLRYLETAVETFEYMQEVIMDYKHKVILKFLDEGLQNEKDEMTNLHDETIFDEKKDERIKLLAENVNKLLINEKNVFEILTNNLRNSDCLRNYLFEILEKSDFKLEDILTKEMEKLIPCNVDKENEPDREKKLEKLQKTLINLITTNFEIQTVVNATNRLNEKSLSFVKESLKFRDKYGKNIFWKLAKVEVLSEEAFEKFLDLLKNFLTPLEIADKMKEQVKRGQNIFNSWELYKNILNFEIFWKGFKKFYEDEDELSFDDFKAILMNNGEFEHYGFIEFFANKDFSSVDKFETKWNLLLETFENDSKGLSEFINHYRLIHKLIDLEDSNNLKFVLSQLKNVLKKLDWDEILNLKSYDEEKNLLLYAAQKAKTVEILEIIFDFLQDFLESKKEFSKVFTEPDFYGNNFLHHVLRCSTEDNLSYCAKKLSEMKILSRKEIKNLLSGLNKFGQNALQHSGLFTIEFDTLKVFQEYFNSEEIVKLVKHRDVFGKNYLDICLMHDDEKVVEEKINEIIEEISKTGLASEEQVERLKIAVKNKISGSPNDEDLKVLSLDWIQVGTSTELVQPIELQELKKLLMHQNGKGENFIHQNLNYDCYEANYIRSILEKVEADLDAESLKQIFVSTNHKYGKNLMQVLVQKTVNESFYEYLWKLMREKFDTETILEILKHKEKEYNYNFLLIVALYGTKQIAEITWRQIEEISRNSGEEFKSQIIQMVKERSSLRNANILHLAASYKNCLLFPHLAEISKYLKDIKELVTEVVDDEYSPTILFRHDKCEDKKCGEALFNVLLNCFEDQNEFFNFVIRTIGCFKRNFIYKLIQFNKSGEVVGFVLETLKNILREDQFMEILMSKDKNEQNLLQYAFDKSENVQIIESIWKHYEELKNLLDIILEADFWGRNVIFIAAQISTAEILDFLCEKLKNFNQNDKVKEAILSNPEFMIDAAKENKSKESHESLWKLLYTFLDKNDILKLVNKIDILGQNVLQAAVEFNTPEVVEFIWNQIKNLITDEEERKDYLRRKGRNGKSLRKLAIENESHSTEMAELAKKLKNI